MRACSVGCRTLTRPKPAECILLVSIPAESTQKIMHSLNTNYFNSLWVQSCSNQSIRRHLFLICLKACHLLAYIQTLFKSGIHGHHGCHGYEFSLSSTNLSGENHPCGNWGGLREAKMKWLQIIESQIGQSVLSFRPHHNAIIKKFLFVENIRHLNGILHIPY